MRIALFCHSLLSDWNHGNAHFLRGIVAELDARGHDVFVFEPEDAWSARHLVAAHGPAALLGVVAAYPRLSPRRYALATLDLDAALEGIDVVIVHEWNDPELVRRLGEHRARTDRYHLLFHDTHHRLITDPAAILRRDLAQYDCVLAAGRSLCDLYLTRGFARRAVVWHEAADVRRFRPLPGVEKERDLVWIGNWGDGERTAELYEFLIRPVKALGLRARVHGVSYPERVLAAFADAGIEYAGWLPNPLVPDALARARVTVHIPRRPYTALLPGVPTIRPFEALACGIPLVSAPWSDVERLFSPGRDYLVARNAEEMTAHLGALLANDDFARSVAEQGRRTVLARHTCAHRVDALLDLADELLLPPSLWPPSFRILDGDGLILDGDGGSLDGDGHGEGEDVLERDGAPSGVRLCDPAQPRSPLA
ncbi:glycosyltransferase [Sorangium sp. So ce1036]|uniref:CgeB family protein n=1 Tax=Sorangium sp. So ce1036 TaxID=3133328 RepID=UPI003EFF93E4